MSQWSKAKRAKVYTSGSGMCGYCGVFLHEHELTIDHVIPKSMGGSNGLSNLMCSCKTCNSSKGTKSLEDYRLYISIGKSKYSGVITTTQYKQLVQLGQSFDLPDHLFPFEINS